MGHITFTGASMEEVLGRAAALDLVPQPTPKVWATGTAGGGAARLWPRFRNQKAGVHWLSRTLCPTCDALRAVQDYAPVVGVIMGSDSDLPTMKTAARILEQFGVPFELTIVSAHRTPGRLYEYARTARSRGLKACGWGGDLWDCAAHRRCRWAL
jgi:hypothetical protein